MKKSDLIVQEITSTVSPGGGGAPYRQISYEKLAEFLNKHVDIKLENLVTE